MLGYCAISIDTPLSTRGLSIIFLPLLSCYFFNIMPPRKVTKRMKEHKELMVQNISEMFYDEIKTQSEFFRYCVESYLEQSPLFMEFLDDYKVNKKIQSKKRVGKSRQLRQRGKKLLEDLALSDEEVENIFDILEEELPEL